MLKINGNWLCTMKKYFITIAHIHHYLMITADHGLSQPTVFWTAFIDFTRPLEKDGFWADVYHIKDNIWHLHSLSKHIHFLKQGKLECQKDIHYKTQQGPVAKNATPRPPAGCRELGCEFCIYRIITEWEVLY